MLYRIIHSGTQASNLAILRVDHSVLDLTRVVMTDINAASGIHPRWHQVDAGLAILDKEELFAQWWADSENREEHKQRMMAEVLVPYRVLPESVTRAYVVSEEAAAGLPAAASRLDVKVSPYMFFRVPKA